MKLDFNSGINATIVFYTDIFSNNDHIYNTKI